MSFSGKRTQVHNIGTTKGKKTFNYVCMNELMIQIKSMVGLLIIINFIGLLIPIIKQKIKSKTPVKFS